MQDFFLGTSPWWAVAPPLSAGSFPKTQECASPLFVSLLFLFPFLFLPLDMEEECAYRMSSPTMAQLDRRDSYKPCGSGASRKLFILVLTVALCLGPEIALLQPQSFSWP